jgi:hypothetical protein
LVISDAISGERKQAVGSPQQFQFARPGYAAPDLSRMATLMHIMRYATSSFCLPRCPVHNRDQ